ncbi:hypothetical protein [Dactylosporangium sp. CA-139066]|uniref:hypothetical protein n=1 Tax=Dactylosporangium sp. CA-139066 TaxID=3239930 RepID=UPI003D906786
MAGDEIENADVIGELLLRELRGAVEDRRRAGDDPAEITADLTGRLCRVRKLCPDPSDQD